ncbi:DUF2231 domain-containing protein [Planomonospora venezuelensis]|uniref:DUF2231 domain-containing protein n=1 Tax=Planomonospora venezuelensis TaxID=1999 RepID=A0A841DE49_PLAVE|nr:DUF2231 domain-containing protein [Planomonospora venezuelensis]MBB5966578.1 hypothetical protein [Planomonospora venezuelensis]GIN02244.1 hypothetical protein Pve01_39020 [Planomonospora venezuelensis]
MFEEILGLPAHPLIIHAAVVLTPLLAVLAAVYALAPRTRAALRWAVLGLAVVTPVATLAARQSGVALMEGRFSSASGTLGERIAEHAAFGTPLTLSVAGLGLASLATVHVSRSERPGRPVELAVTALTVLLAAVAVYYVVRAGHSGATAVWGG